MMRVAVTGRRVECMPDGWERHQTHIQKKKKAWTVFDSFLNIPVVLSSTAEDGEIEVRISLANALVVLSPNAEDRGLNLGKRWFNIPTRYVFCLMAALGNICTVTLKVSLSVAINAMVKSVSSSDDSNNNQTETDVCPGRETSGTNSSTSEMGDFDWDSVIQSQVLVGMTYGELAACLIGARLAEIFGPRIICGPGVGIAALLNFLCPAAARWSYVALIVVRVVQGVFESGLVYRESDALEHAATEAATGVGVLLSLALSGKISTALSWEAVFYIYGSFAFVWSVFWMLLVYNSPQSHPRISQEEKAYLVANTMEDSKVSLPVPWWDIFTSMPAWAYILGNVSILWVVNMMITVLPTYMNKILHFNINASGYVSALPYLFSITTNLIFSIGSQWILRKRWLTRLTTYRVFNAIGMTTTSKYQVGTKSMFRPRPQTSKKQTLNLTRFRCAPFASLSPSTLGFASVTAGFEVIQPSQVPLLLGSEEGGGGGCAFHARKTTLSGRNRDSNPDLPVISRTVYHESDTLDHSAIKAAMIGPALCMISITLVGCDSTPIIVLLILTMVLCGGLFGGSFINNIDLSPNFAGTLSAISATLINILAILGPTMTGVITNGNQTISAWRIVFYVSATMGALPYFVYLFFGSVEEQPWNKPRQTVRLEDVTAREVNQSEPRPLIDQNATVAPETDSESLARETCDSRPPSLCRPVSQSPSATPTHI
uniref:(California timema) hypothetical protein n=1 Tax=Timema californicum TaxID=61474 RepID=A0A7R9J210_TIMCA|nr:unnamed protein product [Timema californicum]